MSENFTAKPPRTGGYNKPGFDPSRRPGGKPGFRKPGAPNKRFNSRPRKVLTPEEREKQLAKKLRRERYQATYEEVHKAFPYVFDERKVKPLVKDIHLELFNHFNSAEQPSDSPVRKSAIRTFLSRYIRSDAYNLACVKLGRRYDLAGKVVADLSFDEISYHKSLIKPKAPMRKPQGRPGFNKRPGGRFTNDRNSNPRFNNTKPRTPFNPLLAFREGVEVIIPETQKTGIVKSCDGTFVTLVLDSKVVVKLPYQKVRVNKKRS